MGEGQRGSCHTKFSARPSFARGRSYLRGWDGRIVGQAAAVAHYCSYCKLPIPFLILSYFILFYSCIYIYIFFFFLFIYLIVLSL